MNPIVLIQTTPPNAPGSMAAYGDLVRASVAACPGNTIEFKTLELFDPSGGSMWKHHIWRMRHGRRLFDQFPDRYFHLLDGSMAGFIPNSCLERTLITAHDLIPALQSIGRLPGRPSMIASVVINRAIRSLVSCSGICAVSQQTKKDVEEFTGRNDVVVIPHAVRSFNDQDCVESVSLPARYIFHVGNNADYKNRLGVLDVYSRLQDFADLHLIMAGPPPTNELRRRAEILSRVIFLEDISDRLLAELYRKAEIFLFPSRYEGFGMPVSEAMAAGCPVVCSTDGALVETAGDAALTAPASDTDQLSAHCRRLLLDGELRLTMAQKGQARAQAYNLSRMGGELSAWYRNCTGKQNLL